MSKLKHIRFVGAALSTMNSLIPILLSLLLLTTRASCHRRHRSFASTAPAENETTTRYYEFKVGYVNVSRLNTTKSLIAVNGNFPGETIWAHEGDHLVITVINDCNDEVAIHWHGVRQFLSAWADGTAYISQCPVQPGESYTHDFTVTGQTGTLLWHAHITWLRATVYGAIVILPKKDVPYPFQPQPDHNVPILLGEWWNTDTQAIEMTALSTGGAPNVSDAATINGYPGPLYNQSASDVFKLNVEPGKTYRLCLVNAALEVNYYFAVANHSVTVVAMDASYVKPFTTDLVFLSPGQTADVLVSTNWTSGSFYMAATVFSIATNLGYPNITTTAIIEYPDSNSSGEPQLPDLPGHNDTAPRQEFIDKLRSINNTLQTTSIPLSIDRDLIFTVGYALEANDTCPPLALCDGVNNTRFSAAVNNISFDNPWNTSLLQAFFLHQNYDPNFLGFPDKPVNVYDYTGTTPNNTSPIHATKVTELSFNDNVQIVLQDTLILEYDVHPFHLHGHNFYIVGEGTGNYDPQVHPQEFNLIDPPQRNTAGVPAGGWIAIRWTASNPGVWLFHCHLEMHLSWGMEMAFVVNNGVGPDQTLPPPPAGYPTCKSHTSTPH